MSEKESIVTGKNEKYEQYRSLLFERDMLKREAGSIMTSYIQAFGKLLTEAFEMKVRCISLKKSIAFCQAAVNRGELPDRNKMERYIDESMKEYREQLKHMIEANDEAIASKTFSEYTVEQCKKLYRRIAKSIHPDLHPGLADDETIMELWNRTVEAYQMNDLRALKELVILVASAKNQHGSDGVDIEIPDIDERIKDIEGEIEEIKNSKPYTYKYILEDEIKCEEKKTEIEQEIKYYSNYMKELEQVLNSYDFKEEKSCLLS